MQQDVTRNTFQAAGPIFTVTDGDLVEKKRTTCSWQRQEASTYGSAGSGETTQGCHIFYPTLIHFLQRFDLFTGFRTHTFSVPSWSS